MALANPTAPSTGLKTVKPTLEDMRLKVLVYSEPGVGKTRLCGTADKNRALGPLLFINAEGGINSLYPNPPDIYHLHDPDDTDPDGGERAEKALTRFEAAYWALKRGQHPWKSVAIDTLSEVIRCHHDYLAKQAVDAGKRQSIHEVTLPDYNLTKNYITYWMRRFRDLPYHLFVTLHAEMKTRADGVDVLRPLLFEKLQKPIEQMFDVVGYMHIGEATRAPKPGEDPATIKPESVRKMIVDFAGNDRMEIHAKWRAPSNVPPPPGGYLINPTMPRIWQILTAPFQPAQPAQPALTPTPRPQGESDGTKE